jgi:hypothetical protein
MKSINIRNSNNVKIDGDVINNYSQTESGIIVTIINSKNITITCGLNKDIKFGVEPKFINKKLPEQQLSTAQKLRINRFGSINKNNDSRDTIINPDLDKALPFPRPNTFRRASQYNPPNHQNKKNRNEEFNKYLDDRLLERSSREG